MALIETSRGRKMIVWRDTRTNLRVVWNGSDEVRFYTAPPEGIELMSLHLHRGSENEADAYAIAVDHLRDHERIDEMLQRHSRLPWVRHAELPPSAWGLSRRRAVGRRAMPSRPAWCGRPR